MSHMLELADVEWHLFACEQLLEKQGWKRFLHRIVTRNKNWVHYNIPKRRKSWFLVDGQTETSQLQSHALYLVDGHDVIDLST